MLDVLQEQSKMKMKRKANSVHDVHQTCCGDKHIKRISNVMNNFISSVNCRPYQ
jgi:hypothetical protein